MKSIIIKIIKRFLPSFLYLQLNLLRRKWIFRDVEHYHGKALKMLYSKKKIKCVFFALFDDVWKYADVYKLMVKCPRFEPIILVCPIVNYGQDNMIQRMEKCYTAFRLKGYNVIKAYDLNSKSYVDVRKEIKPDIIFYTSPYKGLIDNRYYISNFKDKLTVYVPYFMNTSKSHDMFCNLEFHNMVWRYYSETEFHRQLSVHYATNHGRNVVNTGYPGIETFLRPINKKQSISRKCIIWAPHHTIKPVGVVYYSCFLRYCDYVVELARKYSNEVNFVFKPHPLLRNKLYEKWGIEKTDAYYNLWRQMENTSLNEGDYTSLFIESDGMIHDCGSFLVEYLYLNKPVMRTLNGEDLESMYNSFGLDCISNHYLANNKEDIEQFIQNVINGVDPLKDQRTKFIKEVLMPKGSPSQNIIDDILDSIDNQILYRS